MPFKYYLVLLFLGLCRPLSAQMPLQWSLLPGIKGGGCQSLAYDTETKTLFMVMVDGLYRSVNEGEHWEKVLELGQGDLPFRNIYQVDAWKGRVAVLLYSGEAIPVLYYSEDAGTSWDTVALPAGSASYTPILRRIALYEDWILLNFGPGEGVYYSTDGGQNWTEPAFFQSATFSLATPPNPSLIRGKNRLYLYSFFQIYYTDGDPEQWDTLPLPPGNINPDLRFANGSNVLIYDYNSGSYFATTNTGLSWNPVSVHPAVHDAGVYYGQKADTLLTGTGAVFRSVFPFTTVAPENGLVAPLYRFTPFWTDHYLLGTPIAGGGDNGLYSGGGDGMYRIRTDGQTPTYSLANNGLPEGTVQQFFSTPKGMVALGPTGLFRYRETAQRWDTLWLQTEMPSNVRSFAAIEDTFFIIANNGALYKTIGVGNAFQPDFSHVLLMPSDIPLDRLAFRDSILYLFNPYRSAFSTNRGVSWQPIEDPFPFVFYQNIVGADGHFLIVFRNAFSVLECHVTHDWGATWTYLPDIQPDSETRVYYADGQFYAFNDGFDDGQPFLWRSLDNGFTWSLAPGVLTPDFTIAGEHPVVFSAEGILYFGQVRSSFFASGDFGDTWTNISGTGENIPAVGMLALGAHEGYLYMGTGSLGVWRAPLVVPVDDPEPQNRVLSITPNPVRNYLHITLPDAQPRTYVVYDANGRNVARGITTSRQPISAAGWPSGNYWLWVEGGFTGRFVKSE